MPDGWSVSLDSWIKPDTNVAASLIMAVRKKLAGDHARIRKTEREAGDSARGRQAIDALRGTADVRMSTDEIMALTRGEGRPRKRCR
jgi:hypothetical protein